jgi:hypothetical protein
MNAPAKLNNSGIMTYAIVNGAVYILKTISFGRIRPADEDNREYWTCTETPPSNSFQSHENSFTHSHRTDKWHDGTLPWFIRFSKFSHHSFWHDYGHDSSSEGQGPNVVAHSSNYDSRSSSVRDVEAVEVPELKVNRG